MNYKNLCDNYKNKKFSIKFLKKYKIVNSDIGLREIGLGGSSAIFLTLNGKNKLFIKIIPVEKFINMKIRPNYYYYEVKILQFLTRKYLLNSRTPHIAILYNFQFNSNLTDIVEYIINKKKCLTLDEKLTSVKKQSFFAVTMCNLLEKIKYNIIANNYYTMFIEYCNYNLSSFLHTEMTKLVKSGNTDFMCYRLDKIMFEIIFTLAIIQKDYDGFIHGDLFCRNVMILISNKKQNNNYIEYNYGYKKFYIPDDGFITKIIDFGKSIIANKLVDNTYNLFKKYNDYYKFNPFNHKVDIYNLLHDIYDGENLNNNSLMYYKNILKISSKKFQPIRNTLFKFINLNIIDKINKNNRILLNSLWNIDSVKIIEKCVKTPHDYIMSNTFDRFSTLPKNGIIVSIYK